MVFLPYPYTAAEQLQRWENLAGVTLQTSFGGLIGGLAVAVALDGSPGAQGLTTWAALISGVAAALSVDALRFEPTVLNLVPELARKARRTHDALHMLGVAALLAVVAAGLLLG